ncbi:hypothetical protein IWW57_000534 [Coemansia sp. S610]|nr:hypothetical protein IWW57_000534 [Coemansia sp. S610]
MRLLSPFQILPPHVVDLIVDHVAGSSRLQFDHVTIGSEEYAMLLMPLLSVCRDFRAAVLARYCKTYTLDLSCPTDQVRDKNKFWPEPLREIDFPTHLHASKLDITLEAPSVYDGTALKELLRVPQDSFLFPMVHSLRVVLAPTTQGQQLPASVLAAQEIESNVCAFVQRIRLVAPMAKKVCISLQPHSPDEPQFATRHLSSLVEQLGQLGSTVDHYYKSYPISLEPPPTGISSLTAGPPGRGNAGELVMQLARHNAATLRALNIYLAETDIISPLILNDDGNYAEYPRLQELEIQQRVNWSLDRELRSQPPVFSGAIPFPKLRRLRLKPEYPFGDDTPFRGNTGTLEYLSLDLTDGLVKLLQKRQIFTHSSHPKLECVVTRNSVDCIGGLFDTDISCMEFILSIGPNARVRRVDHNGLICHLRPIVPALGVCANIQVLDFYISMDLALWDVIALVKALPLLSDLRAGVSFLGALSYGISEDELPAYVIAKYAPAGERFRCWHKWNVHAYQERVDVRCVLLLALVCPNFDYAAVSAGHCKFFMAHMKEMIAKDWYRPHAKRLQRLLFGGWRDKTPFPRK